MRQVVGGESIREETDFPAPANAREGELARQRANRVIFPHDAERHLVDVGATVGLDLQFGEQEFQLPRL